MFSQEKSKWKRSIFSETRKTSEEKKKDNFSGEIWTEIISQWKEGAILLVGDLFGIKT